MFNVPKLKHDHRLFLNDHQVMVEGALSAAGREGEKVVAQNNVGFSAPASSGGIRKSTRFILHRTARGHVLKLQNTAKHAAAQDSGSGLYGPKHAKYKISVKRKKALAFLNFGHAPGSIVFSRSVMHPGVKPTKFLEKANQKAFEFAGEELRRGMQRVASRH